MNTLGMTKDKPNDLLLLSLGIVGEKGVKKELISTVGGLFLFGKNPSLHLPYVYVKVKKEGEAVLLTVSIWPLLEKVCLL